MLDANQISAIENAMEEEHRRDREALQRLKRFLPPSPNGSSSRVAPLVLLDPEPIDPLGPADAEEDAPETIIDTVDHIMQADTHRKWSVPLMLAHLRNLNFPLEAKKPEATLGLVFSKLTHKRKTIVRVKKGGGRRPALYRGIPREHQEDASDSSAQSERAAS